MYVPTKIQNKVKQAKPNVKLTSDSIIIGDKEFKINAIQKGGVEYCTDEIEGYTTEFISWDLIK